MKMKLVLLIIILNIFRTDTSTLSSISDRLYKKTQKLFDNALSAYEITSNNLNETYLPEVGNGFIATQIKNKCIFMNGLYNGYRTSSHRACIPSSINWKINSKDKWIDKFYSLDIVIGLWKEILVYSDYNITITTFTSRNLPQILVKNISLESNNMNKSILLNISGYPFDYTSPDIDFLVVRLENIIVLNGLTKHPENRYSTRLPVFMVFEDLPNPIHLNSRFPWFSFITAIDDDLENCLTSFRNANKSREKLLHNHASAWIDIWENGFLEITGANSFLTQSVHAAQYYILSSLPSEEWIKKNPSWTFYGLSPTGLAHGDNENDYMGHVFWDMDTWMFPFILIFHRNISIEMTKYRLMMLNSAVIHSNETGYNGARFPWESARTGFETSPSAACSDKEIHINGDISFAIQQLLWIETDSKYYDLYGTTIIESIARFWSSRVTYNSRKDKVEINDVIPPDEYVHSCNNSAFTNIIAKLSLKAPFQLAKRFKKEIKKYMIDWLHLSEHLDYFVNKEYNFISEHDTYRIGTIIKQADVMLLHYPLQYQIPQKILLNSLVYYEKVTDKNGPAMTWAIYSINWFKLKNVPRAEYLFQKNFEYITLPFYVWSENAGGDGAINFHTGMGGFLQNILNGFLGMRLEFIDNGRIMFSPTISTIIYGITLHNIKFQGSHFNFKFNNSLIFIELLNNISMKVFATKESTTYILDSSHRNLVLNIQEIIITSL